MKWVSLVALTVQTSAQVLIIKWARGGAAAAGGPPYLASTVVLFTEVVKTLVSFALVAWECGSVDAAGCAVADQFTRNWATTLRFGVPSLLYTVQNNLMFFSLLKLSAAVQQVTYQLKILTTALLSVIILGRSLDGTKWSALFILLVGVALVQWPRVSSVDTPATLAASSAPSDGSMLASVVGLRHDALLGFAAVLAACFTSGFASVYLEKLLKQNDASIWLRNVQLGVFGSIMGLGVALSQDGALIVQRGFLQGYSFRVVCVVLMNSLGGLLCAAVLKYADNILRCFSTALSIILTCVLSSVILIEFVPDLRFVMGAFLAISATFIYSLGFPRRGSTVQVPAWRGLQVPFTASSSGGSKLRA